MSAEPTVRVTEHTVSLLLEDDPHYADFALAVVYRGHGLWAVTWRRHYCLGADGEWDIEMPTSDAKWLAGHRFTEAEALERAKAEVPRLEVGGRTAAEFQRTRETPGHRALDIAFAKARAGRRESS